MDHKGCHVVAIYPTFASTRHRNPSVLSNYLDTLRLMRAISRVFAAVAASAAYLRTGIKIYTSVCITCNVAYTYVSSLHRAASTSSRRHKLPGTLFPAYERMQVPKHRAPIAPKHAARIRRQNRDYTRAVVRFCAARRFLSTISRLVRTNFFTSFI